MISECGRKPLKAHAKQGWKTQNPHKSCELRLELRGRHANHSSIILLNQTKTGAKKKKSPFIRTELRSREILDFSMARNIVSVIFRIVGWRESLCGQAYKNKCAAVLIPPQENERLWFLHTFLWGVQSKPWVLLFRRLRCKGRECTCTGSYFQK